MVRFTLSILLALLPALALAVPPAFEINNLLAIDRPFDPDQTTAVPEFSQLSFVVTDEQEDLNFSCNTEFNVTTMPLNVPCEPINPTSNSTFQFSVAAYSSAAAGFNLNLTEFRVDADIVTEFQGLLAESEGKDGANCTERPLANNPSIEFASCDWPTIIVSSFEPGVSKIPSTSG